MSDLPGVTEQVYRDLLETGGLIADTASTAGWAALVAFVNEQADDLQQRVVSGDCKTHEAYIAAVEWLAGARYVLDAPALFDAKIAAYKRALEDQIEDDGE